MLKRVNIVDYGIGNLRSIQHKLKVIGIDAFIENNPTNLYNSDALILPGVGHFASSMKNLHSTGLKPELEKLVLINKIPILGICLGMQLMMEYSEEGNVKGLGWIKGKTVKFHTILFNTPKKVPHVGWNTINQNKESSILKDLPSEQTFYFTHSYHVECTNNTDIVAKTEYGYPFTSVVHKDNIYGVQFHPEKSHKEGMSVLRNFINGALN